MVTVTMEGLSGLVKTAQNFLLTESRYIRLLEISVVILLGWSLSSLVVRLINDTQPVGIGLQSLRDTPDNLGKTRPADALPGSVAPPAVRQLFGVPVQQAGAAANGGVVAEDLKETRLNLKLKGVLLNRDDGTRLALIARPGQSEELFHEGDRIEGADIFRIEPARVILRRNGINEVLYMDIQKLEGGAATGTAPGAAGAAGFGRNGIRAVSDRERVVSQGTLRRELNNLPRLLQQARAVPYMENGRSMGFRLVSIQSGSVFEDLGLQHEDIIRSVNGKQLRTPEDALNAYRELRTSKTFELGLLRDGQQVTLNLSVQ